MEPLEPRELTVGEAIALAIQLQKQHHLAEAEQLYARVLDVAPDHPDALHYTGLLAHRQDRTDEAINLIGQRLVFTLEHAVGDDNTDYRLELHGRYSHSLAYVKRVLTQSGLTAEAESAELRNAAGAPVAGLIVRATKPA